MVKEFDQDGHKDRYCDEGNGKPGKYAKDQVSGQNQGAPNKYRVPQDGGYTPKGKEWVNSGQTSEKLGYNMPMAAGRTQRFLPNQIRSINKALTSDSEKTPMKKNTSPASLIGEDSSGITASSDKFCPPLIASDSENTPMQNTSPESLTGEGSSGTVRDKNFTPTLTDLENSVNYDCRFDKILRVAIDYALPEELR